MQARSSNPGQGGAMSVGPLWHACIIDIQRLSQNDWELSDRPTEHPSPLNNILVILVPVHSTPIYLINLPIYRMYRYTFPDISYILICTQRCINWSIYPFRFAIPILMFRHFNEVFKCMSVSLDSLSHADCQADCIVCLSACVENQSGCLHNLSRR